MLNDRDEVFPEYNPAPYGGGYDQALTYGQPLSPSHQTCYSPESTTPGNFSGGGSRYPQEQWGTANASPIKGDGDYHSESPFPGYFNGLPPCLHGSGYSGHGDEWICGWIWPNYQAESGLYPRSCGIENQEAGVSDHVDVQPISYLDPFAGWFSSFQEENPCHSYFCDKDYTRGQQDPPEQEYRSDWTSAVEYIFGAQDQLGQTYGGTAATTTTTATSPGDH